MTPPVAKPIFPAEKSAAAMAPGAPGSQAVSPVLLTPEQPPRADPAGSPFGDDGPLVRRRKAARSSSLGKWIFAIVSLAVAAGLLVGGYFVYQHLQEPKTDGVFGAPIGPIHDITGTVRNLKNADEKAFRLVLAKNQWEKDNDIRSRLGAITAWKHNKVDFWFAVAAKDYGLQRPRDAELLEKGIEKLEQHFDPETLELSAKAEPGKLGAQPALRLTFKAHYRILWWGELIMVTQHGFAYWVIIAAPVLEDAQNQWAELQTDSTGLKIVTDRKGWREQPPKMVTLTSDSGNLALVAPEGLWEKREAKKEDERGDLLLFGRFRGGEKDNRKNAWIYALRFEDRKADLKEAMKAAKDYFETQKKEEDKTYNVSLAGAGQSELGTVEEVGNRKGRVVELKVSLGDEPKRYVLLAVTTEPFLIQCDCTWESRQIWRQDFLDLLRTMKIKKVADEGE